MCSPDAGLAFLPHSDHPSRKDGTGNWGGPETLRLGPRGREHRRKLPSSPPRGPSFSQRGLWEGKRETEAQGCSCCHRGATEGSAAEDRRGARRRAQSEGAARRIHMRGPDIQGAGGKGLHSGLLTFKPQREAGWTAHSPPWLMLRRSPAAHYPPCPQRHQMPAILQFPMLPPSISLTKARVEGTVTAGEGLKGDPCSCPPPLFFLLSPDPFITEEPQFFNALGAGDSIPPLSSLVQAHSPEEVAGPWMGVARRSPRGPHGLHQALHLICYVSQTSQTHPLTLRPLGLAPVH